MEAADRPDSKRITIGRQGRIVVPAAMRSHLGLKEGDTLVLRVEDGELRASTVANALVRARQVIHQHGTPGFDPLRALYEERRRENAS